MKLSKSTLITFVLMLGLGAKLEAAEIKVNVYDDETNGVCTDNHCSLRAAVQLSNTNQDPDNTILLTLPGTYTLSVKGYDDINAAGDLDLLSDIPNNGIKKVTIRGLGADVTAIDANLLQQDPGAMPDRIFHIPELLPNMTTNSVNLTLEGLSLSGGFPQGPSDNDGGALYLRASRAHTILLTIRNCYFFGNQVANLETGGAIGTLGPFGTLESVSVLIENSLFENNSAFLGGALGSSNVNYEINNSTFTQNRASQGAAIFIFNFLQNSRFAMNSSTVVGNNADAQVGGISIDHSLQDNVTMDHTTASITNSILNGNNAPVNPECQALNFSSFNSNGFNILGDLNGCALTKANGDLDIPEADIATVLNTTLADNGGPTKTLALVTTGPAIDAANPLGCVAGNGDPNDPNNLPLLSDQRLEFPRISGATCDIGAYEWQPTSDVSIEKKASKDLVQVGENFSYSLTVTNHGPDIAHKVPVQDNLPSEVKFISVDPTEPTCSFDEVQSSINCSIDSIAVDESIKITITVQLLNVGDGQVHNTASINPQNETDPNPENNTSSITTQTEAQIEPQPQPQPQVPRFLQGGGCSIVERVNPVNITWLIMPLFLLLTAGCRQKLWRD